MTNKKRIRKQIQLVVYIDACLELEQIYPERPEISYPFILPDLNENKNAIDEKAQIESTPTFDVSIKSYEAKTLKDYSSLKGSELDQILSSGFDFTFDYLYRHLPIALEQLVAALVQEEVCRDIIHHEDGRSMSESCLEKTLADWEKQVRLRLDRGKGRKKEDSFESIRKKEQKKEQRRKEDLPKLRKHMHTLINNDKPLSKAAIGRLLFNTNRGNLTSRLQKWADAREINLDLEKAIMSRKFRKVS